MTDWIKSLEEYDKKVITLPKATSQAAKTTKSTSSSSSTKKTTTTKKTSSVSTKRSGTIKKSTEKAASDIKKSTVEKTESTKRSGTLSKTLPKANTQLPKASEKTSTLSDIWEAIKKNFLGSSYVAPDGTKPDNVIQGTAIYPKGYKQEVKEKVASGELKPPQIDNAGLEDFIKGVANDDGVSGTFGRSYVGLSQGIVDAATGLPSFVASKVTGKDVDIGEQLGLSIPESVKQESGIEDKTAYKVGEVVGNLLSYGAQNIVAAPVIEGVLAGTKLGQTAANVGTKLANTKIGQLAGEEAMQAMSKGLAKNAIESATVGLGQNIGMAAQEGLTGKDFVKDVALNTALDLGVGSVLESAPAVVSGIKKAKTAAEWLTERNASKLSDLGKLDGEEVVESAKKVAPTTADSLPKASMVDRAKVEAESLKKDAEAEYERVYEEARAKIEKYISEYKGKGSQTHILPKLEDATGSGVRQTVSNNDPWYSTALKEYRNNAGVSRNAKELSERLLDEDLRLAKGQQEFLDPDTYDYLRGISDIIDEQDNILNSTRKDVKTELPKLKPGGADVNKNLPKYKESTAYANDILPEGEKFNYETETHKQRNAAADERISVDYEGEYKDLSTKDNYTSEDYATARKIFDRKMSAGNEEDAVRLMRKAAENSSRAGQELEAVKHLKENTVSGKVYKAQQTVVKIENNLKKTKPRVYKTLTDDAEQIQNIISDAYKTSGSKNEFVSSVEKNLDSVISNRGKNSKKVSLREEVMKLVKRADYDSEQVVDGLLYDISNLVKQKHGIETLSSENAHKIVDLMEQAEKATSEREKERLIAQADQIIADIEGASVKEKLKSLQRISLLSNPKTLITRNAGGNVLLSAAENIKDIPASIADRLVSLKTGERTTSGINLTKAGEQLKGLKKGFVDQIDDIKHGVDTSPSRGQFELPNKTIWDASKSTTKTGKVFNKTMDFLDKFIGKSLQFGDRPFYESAYASRKAELEKFVKQGKSSLTADEIAEKAKLYALDRTFQSDTKISQWAKKVRKTLPFGDLIIPFTQTPANIIDKLIDYSPAGLVKAVREWGKIADGTFDQKRFVDLIGRSFTGAGAITLGYTLYDKGILTGDIYAETEGDERYQARSFAGEQDYSLKLGDNYYSISWADPVGSLLMIGADLNRGMASKEELHQILFGSMTTAVDGIFDRSFLSGLSDLMGNINNDGVLQGYLETVGGQIASQLTPNVLVSATKLIDPVKRETYDADPLKKQLNVIKSRTPGLSKTLPAKKGITGETTYQYQGRGLSDRALESLLLPYNKTTSNDDKTNDYLLNLYNQTGDKSVLLDLADKKFSYKGTTYTIDDAESYAKFQETQGKAAVEAITNLRKDKEFQKLSASDKAKAVAAAITDAKTEARKEFLISNGYFNKESYALSTLSDSQKEKAEAYGVKATEMSSAAKAISEAGATKSIQKAYVLANYSDEVKSAYGLSDKAINSANNLQNVGVQYSEFETASGKIDTNNNGRYTVEEITAYLNSTNKYTRQQKAAIFAALSTAKNNPYL